LLASKYKADFIKLSFENSGDLLQMINRYITQMLQSYYHPSSVIGEEEEEHREEEEEDEKQPQAPPAVIDYELNYISKEKEEEEAQDVPLFEDDN
jgi:3'-phosphoadenosine 5'-phosphosulfate (PAPS) 3'-phosphatase